MLGLKTQYAEASKIYFAYNYNMYQKCTNTSQIVGSPFYTVQCLWLLAGWPRFSLGVEGDAAGLLSSWAPPPEYCRTLPAGTTACTSATTPLEPRLQEITLNKYHLKQYKCCLLLSATPMIILPIKLHKLALSAKPIKIISLNNHRNT